MFSQECLSTVRASSSSSTSISNSQYNGGATEPGRWNEPYVGLLFGSFLHERIGAGKKLLTNPAFIMGEPHREAWLRSIRNFVLDNAAARFPTPREDQRLIVKEPNGSIGASLLMEAMPESRMVFLVREAYDRHEGYKALVRYEDLRQDTIPHSPGCTPPSGEG